MKQNIQPFGNNVANILTLVDEACYTSFLEESHGLTLSLAFFKTGAFAPDKNIPALYTNPNKHYNLHYRN